MEAGDLHGVDVILLGVAASQKEVVDGCLLRRPEGLHTRSLTIQALANLDNAVECGLHPPGRGKEIKHLQAGARQLD